MTDAYGKAWPYRRIAAALALVAVLSGLTFALLLLGTDEPASPGDEDVSAAIEDGEATEVPEAPPTVAVPPETAPSPPKLERATIADKRNTSPPPVVSGVEVPEVPDIPEDIGVTTVNKPKREAGTEGDPAAAVSGTENISGDGGGEIEQLTLGDQRTATQLLHSNGATLALLGSFITFALTSIGSLTTIIIGWRQERRHDREWTLKIAQLELQMTQQKRSIAPRGSSRRGGPPVKG